MISTATNTEEKQTWNLFPRLQRLCGNLSLFLLSWWRKSQNGNGTESRTSDLFLQALRILFIASKISTMDRECIKHLRYHSPVLPCFHSIVMLSSYMVMDRRDYSIPFTKGWGSLGRWNNSHQETNYYLITVVTSRKYQYIDIACM